MVDVAISDGCYYDFHSSYHASVYHLNVVVVVSGDDFWVVKWPV